MDTNPGTRDRIVAAGWHGSGRGALLDWIAEELRRLEEAQVLTAPWRHRRTDASAWKADSGMGWDSALE